MDGRGGRAIIPIKKMAFVEFEIAAMDFAEDCEVKTKDDLEWFSATLHEHLETAMQDYAMDEEIEDYDPQY